MIYRYAHSAHLCMHEFSRDYFYIWPVKPVTESRCLQTRCPLAFINRWLCDGGQAVRVQWQCTTAQSAKVGGITLMLYFIFALASFVSLPMPSSSRDVNESFCKLTCLATDFGKYFCRCVRYRHEVMFAGNGRRCMRLWESDCTANRQRQQCHSKCHSRRKRARRAMRTAPAHRFTCRRGPTN